ncbi:hypothetical protein GCM10027091_41550 [Streptomyces daliensis]
MWHGAWCLQTDGAGGDRVRGGRRRRGGRAAVPSLGTGPRPGSGPGGRPGSGGARRQAVVQDEPLRAKAVGGPESPVWVA